MALPWLSANTCNSMWRGAVTYFSISTRASPNALLASRCAPFERGLELGVLVDAAHALAAAARDRLDQHRVADLVGFLLEKRGVLPLAVIARHDRHAGLLHQRLGAVFEAHGADRAGRRADECNARSDAGLGELRIFRKEAVARMNALRARALRDLDQPIDAEIALGRGRRSDRVRLVAFAHMQRVTISLGIDRNGAQPQPARRAGDPAGNLAAVGDQDRRKHARRISTAEACCPARWTSVSVSVGRKSAALRVGAGGGGSTDIGAGSGGGGSRVSRACRRGA